jgi:transposase
MRRADPPKWGRPNQRQETRARWISPPSSKRSDCDRREPIGNLLRLCVCVLIRIYGVGPIVACHLLAEIGEARRFQRAEQVVRAAGLDPVVLDSAATKGRGRLSKQGSPHLRWALIQAAQHAARWPQASPDGEHYRVLQARIGSQRAAVSTARKIAKRSYHVLAALERAARPHPARVDRLAQSNGDQAWVSSRTLVTG